MGATQVYKGAQDLSAGALSLTTNLAALGRTYSSNIGAGAVAPIRRVLSVNVHADAAISETVTVTLDSAQGASYDTVLASRALAAETDWSWIPDEKLVLGPGDNLVVAVTNDGAAGNVYAEIRTEE